MERPLAVPLFSAILGLSLAGVFTYFLPPNVLPPLLAATFLALFLRRGYAAARAGGTAGGCSVIGCRRAAVSALTFHSSPDDHSRREIRQETGIDLAIHGPVERDAAGMTKGGLAGEPVRKRARRLSLFRRGQGTAPRTQIASQGGSVRQGRNMHEGSVLSGVPLPIVTLEPRGSRGRPGRYIRLSVGRTCTQQLLGHPGV